MTGANAGHAAGQNFAALLHELGKNVGALVVDEIHLFDTELADLLFAEVLTLAATRTTRTAGPAAGTTFATSTAATTIAAAAFTTATAAATTIAATTWARGTTLSSTTRMTAT